MSASELFRPETHGGEVDGSKETATRIFRVEAPPYAALLDPGIPPLHSEYPYGNAGDPFPLILDSYGRQVTEDGQGTYVLCRYSNDRTGRLPPHPDRTRPGFQSAEVSYQDTQSDFPTVFTYPLKVPGESGNQILTRAGDTVVFKIDETRVVYQISVVLTSVSPDAFAYIGRQNNKLHLIKGRFYRFKAGDIRQTEKSAWETTYTWIEDTGTRAPIGFNGSGSYQPVIQIPPAADERTLYLPPAGVNRLTTYPGNGGFTDGVQDYIRSPYHTVSFYSNAAMVPQWVQILGPQLDPAGWQSLPGNLDL